MNRQQRRNYNKKHKTHYTKEQFQLAEAITMLKTGKISEEDLKLLYNNGAIIDNEDLAPEGALVKLNYERIKEQHEERGLPLFLEWVEENKDKEFHLTREEGKRSLVCLKEDCDSLSQIKGEHRQPWLFNIYTDLLFFDEDTKEYKNI